jgi:hypothetical protein
MFIGKRSDGHGSIRGTCCNHEYKSFHGWGIPVGVGRLGDACARCCWRMHEVPRLAPPAATSATVIRTAVIGPAPRQLFELFLAMATTAAIIRAAIVRPFARQLI